MTRMTLFMTLVAAALACPGVSGQQLPADSAEHAGFSRKPWRGSLRMQKYIDENRITGATGLIARHGKVVYFETYGAMDRESRKPMGKDAIFRIYSMSKAVTGVAVMILHDEGKFALGDPLAKYLPEFGSLKVAVEENGSETGKRKVRLVDAERPITVLDLLRHTSGMNYLGPRDNDGESYYRRPVYSEPDAKLEKQVKRLARAPLVHQPGSTWDYGYSIDVLGRLVEVVSGHAARPVLRDPHLPAAEDDGYGIPRPRVEVGPAGRARHARRRTEPSGGPRDRPRTSSRSRQTWFSGGGGLVGTTRDYARFCQMLLNEGELERRSRAEQAGRAGDAHRLPERPAPTGPLLAKENGFGLTFAINKTTSDEGTKGTYSWGGAAGTRFWIDPEKDLFGIFMVNISAPYRAALRRGVPEARV